MLRSGALVGVLASFLSVAAARGASLVVWSNRGRALAAERARDARAAAWCCARSVAWHDLPSEGLLDRDACGASADGAAWRSDDFQAVWARGLEAYLAEDEAALRDRLPPPPEARHDRER